MKGDKAKSANGKGAWGKSGGNQAQACKSPFSVESQRVCKIPPASNCDNCEMLSSREAQKRLSPVVFFEAGHVGTLCLACAQILDSRGKAGIQHKPYCLYKQFGFSELLSSVLGIVGPTQSPRSSQGPTLYTGLSQDSSLIGLLF